MGLVFTTRSIFLIIACIGIASVNLYGQEVRKFKVIDQEQGLSSNTISSVIQDSRGFMWFGTRDGLNRYDGVEIREYRFSKNSNYVSTIVESLDGYLWIGTVGGGLIKLDPGDGSYTRYHTSGDSTSISSNSINFIHQSQDGDIWLLTNANSVDRLDPKSNRVTRYHQENGVGEDISYFFEDRRGTIWIGTHGGKIWTKTLSSTSFEQLKFEDSDLISNVRCIYQDVRQKIWIGSSSGSFQLEYRGDTIDLVEVFELGESNSFWEDRSSRLWVGTRQGLSIYNVSTNSFRPISDLQGQRVIPTLVNLNFAVFSSDFVPKTAQEISPVMVDHENLFWMITNRGLATFDPETGVFEKIRAEDPFNNLNTNLHAFIYQDRSNTIWIGGIGSGVQQYVKSFFEHYTYLSGVETTLAKRLVTAVHSDQSGTLWFGHSEGAISKFDIATKTAQPYQVPNNQALIFSILDYKDFLWISSFGDGLVRFDPKHEQFEIIGDVNSSGRYNEVAENIQRLFVDDDDVFWIGTDDGLFQYDISNSLFTPISFENKPEDFPLSVFNIAEDESSLWIATLGLGLLRVNKSNYEGRFYMNDDSFGCISSDYLTHIHVDEENPNYLWIGTYGGGLNRFNKLTQKFDHFNRKNGLPNEVIYSVAEDNDHKLWLASNSGLSRFDKNLNYVLDNYDKNDGLQANEFNRGSMAKTADGVMVFGGINGVTLFNPTDVRQERFEPKTWITDFEVFNRTDDGILSEIMGGAEKLRLSYDQNFFSLDFATLDYRNVERNTYKYRLTGVDNGWIETKVPTANYTSIDPGTYTFQLQSTNSRGTWMDNIYSIDIEVVPPYWSTLAFRASLLGVIVVIVYTFYKVRIGREQIKNEKLNNLVNQRTAMLTQKTAELEQTNQELSQMVVQLKSTQSQLIESEKMASLGTLTAGIAHELNNPLNFIGGIVSPLKSNVDEIKELIMAGKIEESQQLYEETHNLLENISYGAKKATEIIKNLLDISPKSEQAVIKQFNFGELIRNTASLVSNASTDITFSYHLDDDLYLVGNPLELNQVILNMLKNGVESFEDKNDAKIEITGTKKRGNIEVIIEDNGTGIEKQNLTQIFEPFFTTKDPGKGTGLGLFISYSIIKKHQGKIVATSMEGKGTKFKITLPQTQKEEKS